MWAADRKLSLAVALLLLLVSSAAPTALNRPSFLHMAERQQPYR